MTWQIPKYIYPTKFLKIPINFHVLFQGLSIDHWVSAQLIWKNNALAFDIIIYRDIKTKTLYSNIIAVAYVRLDLYHMYCVYTAVVVLIVTDVQKADNEGYNMFWC